MKIHFIFVWLVAGATAVRAQSGEQNIREGTVLFQTHCSACHNVHKEIVGPMLASITKKRSEQWLLQFIRNSQSVIAAEDPYAKTLFENYHHQVMPSFRDLSERNIKAILAYIELESMRQTNDIAEGIGVVQESDPSVFHGQLIFQQQCAACHFLDHEGSYGPALGSVSKRHTTQWLRSFIHNSQSVIHAGDPYAKPLFERFDKRVMVPMEFLTNDDIADVLSYIEYRSSSDHPTAGAAGKKNQFGKKYSIIHSDELNQPIQGAGFLATMVGLLLVTGFSVYAFVIRKVFLYLSKKQ